MQVVVSIRNLSGHKFPTGFPSRRAWIHFIVTDAEGKKVFESGRADSNGKIYGNDADEDRTKFEPHYDVITSEDQVQIYEAVMMGPDGKPTYTLMRAVDYIKDNRLLPEGFQKRSVPSDIAVKERAFYDDNFQGGGDTITYKIDVSNAKFPLRVEAYLKYQSVSYSFFKDLVQDREKSNLISRFEKLYLKENNEGVVVSSDTAIVE